MSEAVLSVLGLEPTPAHLIAHRLGAPLEAVYAALVRLNDRGAARVAVSRRPRVLGWVLA